MLRAELVFCFTPHVALLLSILCRTKLRSACHVNIAVTNGTVLQPSFSLLDLAQRMATRMTDDPLAPDLRSLVYRREVVVTLDFVLRSLFRPFLPP